jgi:hypothetical protein
MLCSPQGQRAGHYPLVGALPSAAPALQADSNVILNLGDGEFLTTAI